MSWEVISVASFLLAYASKRALDQALKRLSEPGSLGALVLQKGTFRRATGHVLSWARIDARGIFIRQRNEASSTYIEKYVHEPILCSGDFRFPYAHYLSFFKGIPFPVNPNRLVAIPAGKFDLDKTIKIQGYRNAAVQYRKNKKHLIPFEGPTVRINEWNGDEQFTLSEADYTDQFVTNQREVVDEKIDNILLDSRIPTPPYYCGKSLRELDMQEAKLKPFSSSVLANTIGIAGTVVTSDGYLILPRRNKTVHYEPGLEGCSVSGVLKWSEGLFKSFIKELERQLTGGEGPEELLLKGARVTIVPLAFCRELQRAGKPQFFFHIWADMTLKELQGEWKDSKYPRAEYDSIRWIRLFGPVSRQSAKTAIGNAISTILALLNPKTAFRLGRHGRVALNEEMRTNLFYLAAYVGAKEARALPKHWLK